MNVDIAQSWTARVNRADRARPPLMLLALDVSVLFLAAQAVIELFRMNYDRAKARDERRAALENE